MHICSRQLKLDYSKIILDYSFECYASILYFDQGIKLFCFCKSKVKFLAYTFAN